MDRLKTRPTRVRLIAIPSLIATIALTLVFDARVDISLDEGIYLHGGQRILAGQVLYRGFFALTGPGTFWLYALWSQLLTSYTAAHLLVAMEISLIVAATFLIAGQLVSRLSGIAASACTLSLFLLFSHRIYVNHRWDSACCVVIAAALLVLAPTKRKALFAAGFLSGCAVVFTPPTILFAAAMVLCLMLCRLQRASYDSNGNMTGYAGSSYLYDIENRMKQANPSGGGTVLYGYDSTNHRIYKGAYNGSTYSGEEIYFYGAEGHLYGTWQINPTSGVLLQASVTKQWFGNRLLSPQDELDSRGKYFPFGQERTNVSPANPANDQEKFASYTRDSATALDYADQRYYNSLIGTVYAA